MRLKFSITLACTLFLSIIGHSQELRKANSNAVEKYNIENCINHFNIEKSVKTSVGYQYWFIPQDFLPDGLTVKMSVVGPGQATHAPHKHDGDEVFYVLEGTARFFLNGKTITGGVNTSFYCPNGSEHGISNADQTQLKYLVIRKYPISAK